MACISSAQEVAKLSICWSCFSLLCISPADSMKMLCMYCQMACFVSGVKRFQ